MGMNYMYQLFLLAKATFKIHFTKANIYFTKNKHFIFFMIVITDSEESSTTQSQRPVSEQVEEIKSSNTWRLTVSEFEFETDEVEKAISLFTDKKIHVQNNLEVHEKTKEPVRDVFGDNFKYIQQPSQRRKRQY